MGVLEQRVSEDFQEQQVIVTLFNHPHVLYQTADSDTELPEAAIGLHIDNSPVICIEQGNHTIVLNRNSVPEFCKILKKLTAKMGAQASHAGTKSD